MQPVPRGRGARLAAVAGGLVALLGVVALASRSGFGHSSTAAPSRAYVSDAFTLFLIVFVAMIPVAIWNWVSTIRRGEAPVRQSPWKRTLRTIAIVSLLSIALARHWIHLHLHMQEAHLPALGGPGANSRLPKHHAAGQTTPVFEWTILWIALGLFAVGTASAVYLWRRSRIVLPSSADQPDLSQDVAETIGEAIDDLEREPDPRRAVIAAYARMERVLGRHGLERKLSETALEYMRRVLLGLTDRGPAVERLTSLFERAKFSRHEIDAAMKSDAIGALREIREGIA